MERSAFGVVGPEFISDPYSYYAELRSADPVHQTAQGLWILTRYDDVARLLRDPRFGRNGFSALLKAPGVASGPSMLFLDPPDHTRLRTLVGRAFTPRVIEGLRSRIQGIVDDLLDRVHDSRAMDIIADLAFPLPVTVICELLGVPGTDRDRFRQWSLDIARSLEASPRATEAGAAERGRAAHDAIGEYFRDLVAERRRHPRSDLLSGLIASEDRGDVLSESELLTTCGLLFVAGHETTVNLIGNGVLSLLRYPLELQKLRENQELLSSAIEELLRYESPVQRAGRMPSDDVEIGGKTIPKGAFVTALLGAANRDPAFFPEPDRLDLTRRDNRHVAFGSGIHFCLGAPLARLEGQIAIGALVRRLPALALATEHPQWRQSSEVRGLRTLPVTF